MRKSIIVLIMLLCISLSACSQTTDVPTASKTDTSATESATAESTQADDTSTEKSIPAEDVVYSFLTAYENNPDEMELYLDETLKESLPEGGVQQLLNLDGTIAGMIFTTGASAPDTNMAIVEANIQIGQSTITREFTLVWQGDTWLITAIK